MSREIKFRAWDDAIIHIMPQMVGPFMIKNSVLASYANINAPLMQYTGLKDKNGVEIYEGDILRTKNYGSHPPQIWEVVWSPNNTYFTGFGYKARNGIINSLSQAFTVTRDMEVIGNIYENPELLEAQR